MTTVEQTAIAAEQNPGTDSRFPQLLQRPPSPLPKCRAPLAPHIGESTHSIIGNLQIPHQMADAMTTKPRLIDGQNRVALPREVLDALGVERGDHVAFEVSGNRVRLLRATWRTEP